MKSWTTIIAAALLLAVAGSAGAKKKEPKPEAPKRNVLDIRQAQFFCSDQACGIDVSQLGLIGCSVNGCALVTDIVVSTGPVLRAVPPKR